MKSTQTLLVALTLSVGLSLVTETANAAYLSRLGGLAVYDTDQNITWLADANLAMSNKFGFAVDNNPSPFVDIATGSIYSHGGMNVATAYLYVDAMNSANYLGINSWRLPTIQNPDPTCTINGIPGGFNCQNGEMARLFNNLGGDSQNGYGLHASTRPELALFSNYLTNAPHITGTQWTRGPGFVTENFSYYLSIGHTDTKYPDVGYGFVMVVTNGDVAIVPVPAAAWLLISGCAALMGVARRKAA